MKTLIVHPKDESTEFLSVIYENIPDKTVITGGVTKEKLKQIIDEHDRVMMMGHGSPYGLFSVGNFPFSWGYIIDYSFVDILNKKTDNVFIWCNADRFVEAHDLHGFYTGMFISEVGEAFYCGLPGTKQEDVDQSNFGFCDILSKQINENTEKIYNVVTEEYSKIAETNLVALYNGARLYKR